MNKLDLYDNYLLGRLTEKENESVQKRIENDPDFAKDLADHERVINLIRTHEDNRLRRKFAELDKEGKNKKRFTNSTVIRALSAAAAIALIVISYVVLVNNGNSLDKDNNLASTLPLVHEYMDPPENYFMQRNRGRSIETKASDAMLLYDAAQYKKAAEIFDEILPQQQGNANLLFFGGVSYLLSNQPEKALDCFEQTESLENQFNDELVWYKSLILLETRDLDAGKTLLEEIVNSDSRFKTKAQEILNNLK